MALKNNLQGQRFGRLLVVGETTKRKDGRVIWNCLCDCGNHKEQTSSSLTQGKVKSCGCLHEEALRIKSPHSRLIGGGEYRVWSSMKDRCTNPKNPEYKNYGGRGITYDPKWKLFENFYRDMGDRPEDMTLDRIDVNGDYCKDNCRWTSSSMQAYNKRRQSNNTSGKTGVVFNKKDRLWVAKIRFEKQTHYLGSFKELKDAVAAREEAEMKLLGYLK